MWRCLQFSFPFSKALVDIYHASGGHAFHKHRDVVHGSAVLKGSSEVWNPHDCETTDGKRAVHFSHRSMKDAAAKASDRPDVARKWLEMWRSNCNQNEKIVTLKTDDAPPVIRKNPPPPPKQGALTNG
jgi:hypothetical protein